MKELALTMKPVKQAFAFSLALLCQANCWAAKPSFYVLDIRANNAAILHGLHEQVDQTRKLPVTFLGSKRSTCCFIFDDPSKAKETPILKVNNDEPLLSSSRGDEAYQFLGGYFPAVAEKAERKLAFGFSGMTEAKLIGSRKYQVRFGDATPPVFVHYCLETEGVNFKLYHSLSDKKPHIRYYFALGYEVTPDCPA
jgi:hypothetical protein